MFEPCIEHCYLRFGKQYTPDCDDKCAYAKAVKERDRAVEKIKKYEKGFENNMNLGNSFKEKMIEQVEKFEKWMLLVTDMLKNSQELKNDVSALNELDTALDELKAVNEQIITEITND